MAKKQGKLKNSRGIVDSSDYNPQLAMPGAHDVVEIKEESWPSIIFGWIRGLIAFAIVAVLLLGVIYSGLAANLMMYVPLNPDSSSRSWVVRGTWSETGGKPSVGEQAVVSEDTMFPEEWWNTILVGWAGISNPSIVKIQSTTYDKLYINNDKVTNLSNEKVSGKFVTSPSYAVNATEGEQNFKLKNQYLVECVSGSCKPGTYFIVDVKQIYGEARK